MTWHLWQILYFAAWLCLLIHCLCRRRFFPVLGPALSTKALWLLTFVFFSPVLTGLYVLFGVLLKPLSSERPHPIARVASVLAIVLIAATLIFFEMPAVGKTPGPITLTKDRPADNSSLSLEASAGALQAQNNYSTSTSSMNPQNARFQAGAILILCHDDHLLLDRTARLIQQQLAALPYVKRVTYCPPSEPMALEQILPDVFVVLALPRIDETRLPTGRKLAATITCTAGRRLYPGPSHSSYGNSPPVINFNMQSTLRHESSFAGVESRQARYKQQAENIADQIAKSLITQFDKWKNEHGLMPDLPDYLYGASFAPPQFPSLQARSARVVFSGPGLLCDNHTTWIFADDRPTVDSLTDFRDQLTQLGWRGGSELDRKKSSHDTYEHTVEGITMSKDDEHIAIFRQRRRDYDSGAIIFEKPDRPAEPMPMIAHYQSLFTSDRTKEAMDRLLDSGLDLETILIFERSIRSGEQKQKLISLIEQNPAPSMRGCLTVAEFYAADKQPEKARAAFMRARALARAERTHDPETQRFKSVAKKIGDESLAKADPALEHFTAAGFIDLTALPQPLAIEKALNEPACFCVANEKDGIATLVLKIQAAPSSQSPAQQQYELVRILKTPTSSSIGTSGYYPGPVGFTLADINWHSATIENLPDERFRFTVKPDRPN